MSDPSPSTNTPSASASASTNEVDYNSLWTQTSVVSIANLRLQPITSMPKYTQSNSQPGDELKTLHQTAIRFWKSHGKQFRKMWTGLSVDSRRYFLGAVAPFLPESTEKPYTLDCETGEKTDLRACALLIPELFILSQVQDPIPAYNIKELKRRQTMRTLDLVSIFETIVNLTIENIAYDSLRYVRLQVSKGRMYALEPRYKGFVFLFDSEDSTDLIQFGALYNFTEPEESLPPVLQTLFREGSMCSTGEWDMVYQRVHGLISHLLFCADEYRKRLLGKEGQKLIGQAYGCEKCGAMYSKGGKLKMCQGCKIAFYCGKECQMADWTAHKELCTLVARGT
ncbi:hypothetical protein HDV05_004029 [Chytridiales sp. JEL 0842]|nr:hypothetical protein HDV05_004029 [Chytridiales sp. JEL 0842]